MSSHRRPPRASLGTALPLLVLFLGAGSWQPLRGQDLATAAPAVPTVTTPGYGRLLLGDARGVLGAPLHWRARQWGLFSLSVAGVGVLSLADGSLEDSEERDKSSLADQAARVFEPLGSYGAFGVLGAFYVTGAVRHDGHAMAVAEDGLAASLIAGGILTPALKVAFGRSRPRDTEKTGDFKPFGGGSSFPSGHATEAFAVASTIAAEYDPVWVKAAAYGSATLVGFARIHHQAHFLSDVAAGALIGTSVGRTVAHLNREEHQTLAFVPLEGPHHQRGLAVVLGF